MKYYTYILKSSKTNKHYIGYTYNLESRLEKHNSGNSKSTKSGIPWHMVYFEEYDSKSDAIKRENEIKRKKSKIYIENLIDGGRPD